MAENVKINIGGSYKELDKGYVNIGGSWKEIEKIWCNIGGVWKEVGLEKVLSYYGLATGLSVARYYVATASVGNYGIFAGGMYSANGVKDVVDAYTESLTRSTPTSLGITHHELEGASNSNYAVFGTGYNQSYEYKGSMRAYNASLTRSTPESIYNPRANGATASTPTHAIFHGGRDEYDEFPWQVYVYNSSLTMSTVFTSHIGVGMKGNSITNYALIAGGDGTDGRAVSTVTAYNSSLTVSRATLSDNAYAPVHASNGEHVIFARYNIFANAFNNSLTRISVTPLNNGGGGLRGASVGGYFIFGGEEKPTEVYNASLTKVTAPPSTPALPYGTRSVAIGDFALFGSGYIGQAHTSNVYAFKAS